MTTLRDFNREFDLGGRVEDGFGADIGAALGRAHATLARRRGLPAGRMLIAQDESLEVGPLRDAIVQGWLLAGEDVVDIGVCSAAAHEGSLHGYTARGGIHIGAEGDVVTTAIFLGPGPLTGASLEELFTVSEQGRFPAGEGSLVVLPPSSETSNEAGLDVTRTAVDG